jgi:hypothetical protein
MFTLFPNSKP